MTDKATCALCGHDEFYDDGICTMCGHNINVPVTPSSNVVVDNLPSGTTFEADGSITLPEGGTLKRYVVHITMGKAVTVYAEDEREAETLALETVENSNYATVIAIEPEDPDQRASSYPEDK